MLPSTVGPCGQSVEGMCVSKYFEYWELTLRNGFGLEEGSLESPQVVTSRVLPQNLLSSLRIASENEGRPQ